MKNALLIIFACVIALNFSTAQNTTTTGNKPKTVAKTSSTQNTKNNSATTTKANATNSSVKTPEQLAKNNKKTKKTKLYTPTVVTLGQGVQMKFDTELIDLGKVKKGEKRNFKYNFVNTGNETIEFDIVSGCDCTTTDWPRTPIKSGQKGTIDVTFDSTEKEKSETVDVDIYLMNKDPQTNRPIFRRVKYKFELIN